MRFLFIRKEGDLRKRRDLAEKESALVFSDSVGILTGRWAKFYNEGGRSVYSTHYASLLSFQETAKDH